MSRTSIMPRRVSCLGIYARKDWKGLHKCPAHLDWKLGNIFSEDQHLHLCVAFGAARTGLRTRRHGIWSLPRRWRMAVYVCRGDWGNFLSRKGYFLSYHYISSYIMMLSWCIIVYHLRDHHISCPSPTHDIHDIRDIEYKT